jgi:hypothetical protein
MNIKNLIIFLKNKKAVLVVGLVLLVLMIFVFLFNSDTLLPPVVTDPIDKPAPVVVTMPELKFVAVTPDEGNRETFDTLSQTFFEFSAALDQTSAQVVVTPAIPIKTTVYEGQKNVLVIEPSSVEWKVGVQYVVTIKPGLRGAGGEELKKEIDYKLSVTVPEVFEGGDPIITR